MPNNIDDPHYDSLGAWAKRCYFAGRAAMEATLRPYGLGTTQWYVLHQLATDGPTMQRELLRMLEVERATLSVIVSTLVRKGLVEQLPDRTDHRQKLLRLTQAGTDLWGRLPDITTQIRDAAFAGIDKADIAIAVQVLETATGRLNRLSSKGFSE